MHAHGTKKYQVGATDVSFEDPDAFAKAIKNVRSDVNFDDWCLVGYEGKSTLRLVGKGRGGLDALLDATDPTGVNYGLLRVGTHNSGGRRRRGSYGGGGGILVILDSEVVRPLALHPS